MSAATRLRQGAIAGLPMYDWPEERGAVDALWHRIATRLRNAGFEAPDSLTRTDDLDALWLHPRLLLAQTCGYPLETVLAGRVTYVATPRFDVTGFGRDGSYRSAIIMAGTGPDVVPLHDGRANLPDIAPDARLAFNGTNSMSGFVALARDLAVLGRALPQQRIETGSHRASLVAVATGQADIAAIDCVSLDLARRHERHMRNVFVAGWTAARPALPLITALATPPALLHALRTAAMAEMDAIVLTS